MLGKMIDENNNIQKKSLLFAYLIVTFLFTIV